MKNKSTIIGIAVVAIFVVVVGAVSAYGMMGQGYGKNSASNPSALQSIDKTSMQAEAQKALEAGDYNAFVAVHEKYGHTMQITKEQFAQMQKWHEAVKENDVAAMQQMRDSGFKPGFGMHQGQGAGNCNGNCQGKGNGQGRGMHFGQGRMNGNCPMLQN